MGEKPPQKWTANKLSAQALEFYSAYVPRKARPPHPAELDRFSAPDGWEFSPERMDRDSPSRYPGWRSTQSETIKTAWPFPDMSDPEQGFQGHNGYGVRWQKSHDGESSPIPRRMLTQWLDETRGARTGEDIRHLLEQSSSSPLPAPSLEYLVSLRDGSTQPSGNIDDGTLEYVGYDLIPESEVTNVHGLLEDYYRQRTGNS